MKLTDRQQISGLSLSDIFHVVSTTDTSQSPAGSSYYAQIQQIVEAISGITSVFQNNMLVELTNNKTLGKYVNGQTILSAGKTFEEVLADIALEFIPPTFSTFSRTTFPSSPLDLGQNIAIGSQTFSWSTTRPANISANTMSITQNFPSPINVANGLSDDGNETIELLAPIFSNTPIQNTTVYTISAYNTQGTLFSRILTASWRYRWYYGKNASSDLTEAQITGLTNTALVTSVTNSFVSLPATPGFVHLIIPTGLTQPSDFRDSTSGCFGNNIPFTDKGIVNITNVYGVTTTYRKWESNNMLNGAINVWMCP